MITKKNLIAVLVALGGFPSLFREAIPAYVRWPVAMLCLAGIVYVVYVHDRRQQILMTENRWMTVGLCAATALAVSAVAVFIQTKFPRVEDASDRLGRYYGECRKLDSKARRVSNEDLQQVLDQYNDFVPSLRHLMREIDMADDVARVIAVEDPITFERASRNGQYLARYRIQPICRNLGSFIGELGRRRGEPR